MEQVLIENDIDIVLGCETHLCPSIKNSEFIPENYTCFRKDRQDGWGGVIIITKSHLITEQIMSSIKSELIAIKIETLNQPVVLCSLYRPPNSKVIDIQNITNEIEFLVKKHKNSPIWIGGDINLPDIEWESNAIKTHQYLYKINETFIQMMYDCHLDQVVNFPTRGKNILDVLLTNNTSLIERIIDVPGISAHNNIVVADFKACVLRLKPHH